MFKHILDQALSIFVSICLCGCLISCTKVIPADKKLQISAQKAIAKGDYQSAIEQLTLAIQIDPQFPPYYHQRAEAYREIGEITKSDRDTAFFYKLAGVNSASAVRPSEQSNDQGVTSKDRITQSDNAHQGDFSNALDKERWAKWQEKMRATYGYLTRKSHSTSDNNSLHDESWYKFLQDFSDENPYTDEDNIIRKESIIKLSDTKRKNIEQQNSTTSPIINSKEPPDRQNIPAQPILSRQSSLRVALIIGNGRYSHLPPLANPVNDARLMADRLDNCDFLVDLRLDADRREIARAINLFFEKLNQHPGSTGLFYYAGHGIQIDGMNYIVPTDAQLEHKHEIEIECYRMSALLEAMESSGTNINIVILDACRNNPFKGFRSQSRGLAIMEAPIGSILIYSTAPGNVAEDGKGNNSLFTTFLAKHILTPEIPIEQMLKSVRSDLANATNGRQIPWESSSLMGNFFFMPK